MARGFLRTQLFSLAACQASGWFLCWVDRHVNSVTMRSHGLFLLIVLPSLLEPTTIGRFGRWDRRESKHTNCMTATSNQEFAVSNGWMLESVSSTCDSMKLAIPWSAAI